jgi:Response regulator containing CheY-like receiver domain and AraC-type DNA-binding domain
MYKVLVVEDELILRRGFISFIPWEEYGCTICGSAKNGKEGLSLIRELRPDIVFADLKMPVMSGLEMIAHSKAEYAYSAVIISGYSDFEYVREALKIGVSDYLLKPVGRDELINVLQKLLRSLNSEETQLPVKSLSPYIGQALQFIAQNYQNRISVQDVAAHLELSTDHLSRLFKKEIDQTVHEYLTDFRVRKACEFLSAGRNLKVYEVAELVGFADYKYFHVVFTKHLGLSPMAYKKAGINRSDP